MNNAQYYFTGMSNCRQSGFTRLAGFFYTLTAFCLFGTIGFVSADEKTDPVTIHRTVIEQAREKVPRSDTASVVELSPGHFMMVYHRFRASRHGGSDFGQCSIWAQWSQDGGRRWTGAREIITARDDDINVQAPAICRLPDGELLLLANHAHGKSSTTMELHRSKDNGRTWKFDQALWKKSKGQWLQGGNSQLLLLSCGRLIFGVHGGTGSQGKQKNDAWCMMSDNRGRTWHRSEDTIVLPMRGAMEASITELASGELLMSLRTQLGGPFLTRSTDRGENWSPAQPSGLVGPESSTCLRRIPGTDILVLFWNGSQYLQGHHHYGERTPLSVAISHDEGHNWRKIGNLETDPDAEFTNLDCFFAKSGDAIVTYSVTRPAWERRKPAMSLHCAVVPRRFFIQPAGNLDSVKQ
ncbi:MAG: exo-alpha-sialidase [Pirellulales bacterium]|nr:exo-alpha-sialidase [Pirellulales bacterium]